MKNLLLPLLVTIVVLATSCSKDRDCVCTYKDALGNTVTLGASVIKGTKSAAKKACEKNDTEWADINGSCTLK